MSELDEFLAERNRALKTLDIKWARKNSSLGDDETLLCALHKARYECLSIDKDLRAASGVWLRERGYKRMFMQEFTEELPT